MNSNHAGPIAAHAYRLTDADVTGAVRLEMSRSLVRPRVLILPAMLIVGLIAAWQGYIIGWAFIGGLTAAGLMTLLGWFLVISRTRRNLRTNKLLHTELAYSWDDAAFFVKTDYSQSRIPWPDFFAWLEGPGFLLIHTQTVSYFILPDRIFARHEDRADVIGHLRAAGVPVRFKKRRQKPEG